LISHNPLIVNTKSWNISKKKICVIYYSWTERTALVAESIAEVVKADLVRIKEIKIRKGVTGVLSGAFQAIFHRKSDVIHPSVDISNYDLIILGAPVWCGNIPPAINGFLSKTKFSNKAIVLLITMALWGGKRVLKALDRKRNVIEFFIVKTGRKSRKELIDEGKKIGRRISSLITGLSL